jgi:hypothetical protein
MYISVFATTVLSLAGIARAVNTEPKSCENGPWVAPALAGISFENAPADTHFCEGGHADGDVLTGT